MVEKLPNLVGATAFYTPGNGKLSVKSCNRRYEETRQVSIALTYLEGSTPIEIAGMLVLEANTDRQWHASTIQYILTNERYIGDAIFQKRYASCGRYYKAQRVGASTGGHHCRRFPMSGSFCGQHQAVGACRRKIRFVYGANPSH